MLGDLLCTLVRIYIYVLIARVIISFIPVFRPGWSPPDALKPLVGAVHMITDPPIEFLRRFIPPLTSGGVALDLAFIVWFVIVQWAIAPLVCRL